MGAQLHHRGDAHQAQGDGTGEPIFVDFFTEIFSKRTFLQWNGQKCLERDYCN